MNQPLTKEEFEKRIATLATKKEIKQQIEHLANKVDLNTIDIKELRQDVIRIEATMNLKFDQALAAIDKLAAASNTSRSEKAAIDHALNRHEKRLDSLEQRMDRVEGKVG